MPHALPVPGPSVIHPEGTSNNLDIFQNILSKDSDRVLQWWSIRRCIWEHKAITNTSGPEIIVFNCCLHQADPNYIGTT